MYYLTLCCIAKDEDLFLREWLAYHAQRGVEHFYVYDNMSEIPIRKVLGDFMDDSRLTLRRIPGSNMQIPAYNDCLESFGAASRWMGFLDLDEFAFPVEDDDLRVFLSEFEAYGGFAATWWLFNSSGHLKRPGGPVIKNYTQAFARQHSYTAKCFVNPAKTAAAVSPHHFHYADGEYCVNENHFPLSPGHQYTFATGRRIRINHYFVKSQQDFEEKLRRGRGDTADPAAAHDMTMFLHAADKAYVENLEIQRFLPELENALAENRLPASQALPGDLSYDERMETAMAFFDAGKPDKCLACLCCGNEEYREKADFWTLRALAAQCLGGPSNLDRAERFLSEAVRRESTEVAYDLLRDIWRSQGKAELAEAVEEKRRIAYYDFV